MKRLADRALAVAVVVGIACTLMAVAGCAKKTENATPGGAPTTQATGGSGHSITINWKAGRDSCSQIEPPVDSLIVGMTVMFTSNAPAPDTVHAPAGCFSSGDTSFVVSQGRPQTLTAHRSGAYPLTSSLPICPEVKGGTGPTIIIGDGGH